MTNGKTTIIYLWVKKIIGMDMAEVGTEPITQYMIISPNFFL